MQKNRGLLHRRVKIMFHSNFVLSTGEALDIYKVLELTKGSLEKQTAEQNENASVAVNS